MEPQPTFGALSRHRRRPIGTRSLPRGPPQLSREQPEQVVESLQAAEAKWAFLVGECDTRRCASTRARRPHGRARSVHRSGFQQAKV